jgi:hypothetical protein
MNLKLFAYNQMSWNEFQCFNWLIIKESNWNPKARNGSHYGLGQMRSLGIRALVLKDKCWHRLNTSLIDTAIVGRALSHFERKGWH